MPTQPIDQRSDFRRTASAKLVTLRLLRCTFLALPLLVSSGTTTGDGGGVGRIAPACSVRSLDDAVAFEWKAAPGRVLYVDFWASWCAPCARGIPFLNALQRDYGARGLEVVGISVDERIEDARAFLRRYPAGFTVAGDPDGRCPKAFSVSAMPSSFLIDRHGVIRHVHLGFRDGDIAQRRAMVEKLLAEDGIGGVLPGAGR